MVTTKISTNTTTDSAAAYPMWKNWKPCLKTSGARVHGLDRTRLHHIYEVREALEPHMSRRFAEDARPSELRHLQEIQARHEKAAEAGNLEAVALANRDFHHLINTYGGNPLIIDPVSRYIDLGRMLVRRFGHEPGYLNRVIREHRALVATFRRHDASRAADLGAAHVRTTREVMLAHLDDAPVSVPRHPLR